MSASEDVTLFPGRKKSKSKVQVIRDFATAFAKAEEDRAAYLYEAYFAPDGVFHENSLAQEEFPGTLQALESLAEEPGDELAEGNEMFILRKAWEGAQGDPLYAEMCADVPEERRYISWVSGLAPESIPLPEGWPGWEPCIPVGDQPAMALKSVRAKKLPDDPEAVKALSEKKTKVPKKTTPESIRAAFDLKMAALDPTTLYKPWMATKSLRLVTSMEEFQAWADRVFTDKSLWRPCPVTGELMPVVAVDTETFGLEEGHSGLDTRLIHGKPQIDTAGVCLCADGYEALYIPINAIDGNVIDRVAATALLQEICDRCLLVFFNAKFDREVLRITMGIKFRRYPYFEDVQVLHFLKDPKSDVDEEVSNARSEGLKSLSSRFLGIDQIELDDLAKVKVKVTKADGSKGVRTLMAPFHWIPTSMAYLYAAPDALTTWLLWDQMHEECRKMPYVHKIDHHLVDALAWIERQRPKIDIETLKKTCGWHQEKLDNLSKQLSDIAGETFNPKSADQLSRILFSKLNFKVVKRSAKTGKPSTDEEVLEALKKAHPHHSFLETLERFKGYASLHPNHLHFDPRDLTARLHFKQCTVAGGRLAAMGGEFEKDGGFGMNPQAIKAVGDNKWIPARRLRLEDTEDLGEKFDPAQVPPIDIEQVNDACREVDKKTGARGALSIHGVIGNHVVRYCGEWWSIAKDETSITLENGQTILLDPTSQVDAEEVVNLRKLFVADPGYTYFVIDYCLAPGTRLLTKDLQWKDVVDVTQGEKLIGFDEGIPEEYHGRRRMREATVEQVQEFQLPCVQITFESGKQITCSETHSWLTRVRKYGYKGRRGQYDWREARNLKVGQEIGRLCDTWDYDDSGEARYLEGIYDGEGWVGVSALGFGQNEGEVIDRVQGLLESKGYPVTKDTCPKRVSCLRLTGGRDEVWRFLGSIRPRRLIQNMWKTQVEGKTCQSKYTKPDRVVAIEHVGVQRVIAIRTDTHTFVAEGLLSHNCNVEMRVAADCSLEPLFIEEFLHGSGDFHTLTAKSVFPEFCELQDEVKRLQVSDPLNKDSGIQSRIKEAKAKMKKLRSLAKIINFALLYGGTEYSIFQNMQLEDPTITKEKAKAMVDAYWESVPKFKEWAETQQIRAKTTMTCVTRSGRKINFKSAMETLGIYVPAKEHYQNNRTYWNLMRRADDLKAAKKDEEAQVVLAKAQEMMLDKNTGVRNVGDYNKFVGKTLRVSVNAPLQGLAGDFMRAALVAIYLWSQDAGLGDVFRLHATVHDEIDFSVKNEYVPYILPRIDRLMKHRKMHERMKWPVPLETDCEYGSTWDVKEHLTGDDTHTPAGYTKIPGLESYIPQMFDDDTVHGLFDALVAGDRQSVVEYLKGAVHPRCHGNIPRIANTTTSLEDADRTLTAILQLHEYWTIDEADPDDPEDETLGEYQERMGLEPLDTWIPVEVMPVNVTVAAAPSQVEETPQEEEATSIQEDAAPEEPPAPVEPSPQLKMVPRLVKGYPQLRDLTEEEWALLQAKLGLGHSTALAAAPDGESLMRFSRVSTEQIPEDFLVLEVEGSVCG